MRIIPRQIISIHLYEGNTRVYLSCGHDIADFMKNKWKLGSDVNCSKCLDEFIKLEYSIRHTKDE